MGPGSPATTEIIQALGLVPQQVRALSIEIALDAPVLVLVEMIMTEQQGEAIAEVLKRYNLQVVEENRWV